MYLCDWGGGDAVDAIGLLDFHHHVESGVLGTGDVESCVAIWLVALYRGTAVLFLTNVTLQTPARFGHIAESVDRLEENGILEADLGDPQRAYNVAPLVVNSLLEGTKQIWAKNRTLRYESLRGCHFWKSNLYDSETNRSKVYFSSKTYHATQSTGREGEKEQRLQSHWPSGM